MRSPLLAPFAHQRERPLLAELNANHSRTRRHAALQNNPLRGDAKLAHNGTLTLPPFFWGIPKFSCACLRNRCPW